VYYYTTRFYNKTLTCISFYCKIIGNCVILHWYAISASKIIIIVFFALETNTGDVGGFLLVQHYWEVNICCELLNPGLWQFIEAIMCLPQTRHLSWWMKMNGIQMVSPYCMYCSVPKGTSKDEATLNSKKNQAHSLSCYWILLVWRHQAVS